MGSGMGICGVWKWEAQLGFSVVGSCTSPFLRELHSMTIVSKMKLGTHLLAPSELGV